MIATKQLGDISLERIHEAFVNAFSDYVVPSQLSYAQLKYMMERRGCQLGLSFGAFHDDKLVGFTLNGIGTWNGRLTAYDVATGIIKEFRKQGIASNIFHASLPVLREHHITHYLLEVIRSNTPAVDLYKKSGFEVTREFECYRAPLDNLEKKEDVLSEEFHIQELEQPNWEVLKSFWDFTPSWQNSIDAITRKKASFTILGIFHHDNLAGYGIIERHTGDIPQVGIARAYRRRGLGTTVLKHLAACSEHDEIKMINTLSGYAPFTQFAESINLSSEIGQYEMILKL